MNPWAILGWILVAIVAWAILIRLIIVLLVTGSLFSVNIKNRIRHLRTRRIKPKVGQRWRSASGKYDYWIRYVDDGRILIESGRAQWSETPIEWKKRIKEFKLYLANNRAVFGKI